MRETLGRIFDIAGPHAEVIAKLNMPPSFVILDRVVWGVSAILGKLDVTGPWRAMLLEYRTDGPPATELGAAEAGAGGVERRGALSASAPGSAEHPPSPTVAAMTATPSTGSSSTSWRPATQLGRRSCSPTASPRARTRGATRSSRWPPPATTCSRPTSAATAAPARPRTSRPTASSTSAGDLLALLDATGHDDAVFVGHDWGALLVWDLARIHPDRVRAVINVSVPYTEWPAPPTDVFKAASGDRFFYILYFQQVGPAETEMALDVERTMRTVLWAASGDGFQEQPPMPPPAEGTGWLDVMAARELPAELPAWLTEADVAAYVDSFTASGFFGPVSWYRNLDHNHALVEGPPGAGDAGVVHRRQPRRRHRLPPGLRRGDGGRLPDLRGTVLIEGAGHWTQQEAPEAFNRALLDALASSTAERLHGGSAAARPAVAIPSRRPCRAAASGRRGCRPTTRTG